MLFRVKIFTRPVARGAVLGSAAEITAWLSGDPRDPSAGVRTAHLNDLAGLGWERGMVSVNLGLAVHRTGGAFCTQRNQVWGTEWARLSLGMCSYLSAF